ncbi:MAG: glycosyltransferase [Beijerinckiaceae bacterium]
MQFLDRDAALLAAARLNAAEIALALADAQRIGVAPLEQAIASGLVEEDAAARALAAHLRLPFTTHIPQLSDDAPWALAAKHGIAPLRSNPHGWRFALAPRDRALNLLAAHDLRRPAGGLVVTTRAHLATALHRAAAHHMEHAASHSLPDASPRDSCRDGLGAQLIAVLIAVAFGVLVATPLSPRATMAAFAASFGALFMTNVATRLAAIGANPHRARTPPCLSDAALPIYTLLIPLYREARIAPRLIAALRNIDYPPAKLDIKLLLESDDHETLHALRAAGLAPWMEVIVAPDGKPRTKPRALNLGLAMARGDHLAVFDAEDRPHPRQLRDAAARFSQASDDVACLQARLAIENDAETWLTRLFALEYAVLFGLITPSLSAQQLPFALGGTSNHFRTAALRAVGGWDAWNVTEDADLGLRLFRRGWRIAFLDSITWEEAPLTLRPWLRQRTRWLKGWMQTTLTHLRAPRTRSLRELGAFAFLHSIATSLGAVLSALFGPLLVALALHDIALGEISTREPVDVVTWSCSLTLLVSGLAAIIAPAFAAAQRFGSTRLAPWIVALPLYYLLVSVAAWRALFDLALRPHHWDKTEHGLSKAIEGP